MAAATMPLSSALCPASLDTMQPASHAAASAAAPAPHIISNPAAAAAAAPAGSPDIPTFIALQIPHLTSLHAHLALPPSALHDDLTRIDAAVRAAIAAVVRGREDEVGAWERRVGEGKVGMGVLARAMGDKGRGAVAAHRRESSEHEYARLAQQTEELERRLMPQVYNERLAAVQGLLATIDQLAILLGPPFEPASALAVVGTSTIPRATAVKPSAAHPAAAPTKRQSGRAAGAAAAAAVASAAVAAAAPGQAGPGADADVPVTWHDVSEEIVAGLQAQVDKALAERDVRLRNLETQFNDLIWYRAELDLPPLPVAGAAVATVAHDDFPAHLLPCAADSEERPGAHATYLALLARVVDANPLLPGADGGDGGGEIQGLDGVEPEVGLVAWAETLLELWIAEKDERDAQIQQLYERVEPLWSRLDVPQGQIDLFIEGNRGSGLATIRAYEDELERVLEIRRTSLSSFVVGVRKEIAALQESLMMSEDEKGAFGAFINDDFSEELLKEHEDEAARLRAEVELRGALLPRVNEWLALRDDEDALELSAADPNRFKKRGQAMLLEEKMRKRVEKLKPRIEAELLEALPAWELEHERPFMAMGASVLQTIADAAAAKEAAKEAKKRAKMGLGPIASGKSAAAAAALPPPTTTRKRTAAPTPATGTLKRARVVSASASTSTMAMAPNASRIPSTAARRIVSGSSALGGGGGYGGYPLPSPMMQTPTPVYGLQRAFGREARGVAANAPSTIGRAVAGGAGVGKIGLAGKAGGGGGGGRLPGPGVAAHAAGHKGHRRESFRPRMSVVGGFLRGSHVGVDGVAEEEDEDVF